MKKVQFRKRPEKPIMWTFATGLFYYFCPSYFLDFSSAKKDDVWNPLYSLKRDGGLNYYNIGKVPQRAELLGSVSLGSLPGNSKTEIISPIHQPMPNIAVVTAGLLNPVQKENS